MDSIKTALNGLIEKFCQERAITAKLVSYEERILLLWNEKGPGDRHFWIFS
jgi:hypothetical protein